MESNTTWVYVSTSQIWYPYGLDEVILSREAPKIYEWLEFDKERLLASRIQSGKLYNPETQPWYRLDNVGSYTFQIIRLYGRNRQVVGPYSTLPNSDLELFNGLDKPVVVGSKILMLVTESIDEAYYISEILNLQSIIDIIDAYAVNFK